MLSHEGFLWTSCSPQVSLAQGCTQESSSQSQSSVFSVSWVRQLHCMGSLFSTTIHSVVFPPTRSLFPLLVMFKDVFPIVAFMFINSHYYVKRVFSLLSFFFSYMVSWIILNSMCSNSLALGLFSTQIVLYLLSGSFLASF